MQEHAGKERPSAAREGGFSVHRCPFCHDDVSRPGSVVCADCLARHHADCWSEGGACGACHGPRKLAPEPLTLSTALRLLEEQGYGAAEIKALLTASAASPAATSGEGSVLIRRVVVPLVLFVGPPVLSAGLMFGLSTALSASEHDTAGMTLVGLLVGVLVGFVAMIVALRRG